MQKNKLDKLDDVHKVWLKASFPTHNMFTFKTYSDLENTFEQNFKK